MGEYYDKEKFTGGRTSSGDGAPGPDRRQAPPKRQDNSGWYSWPVVIILFALGAWPIALALMMFNLFGSGKGKPSSSQRSAPRTGYDAQAQSAVERAMRRAEQKIDHAGDQFDRAMGKAEGSVDRAMERAVAEMERTIDRAAKQVEQAGKAKSQSPAPQSRASKTTPKVKSAKPQKAKTKPAGTLLRVMGIIFMLISLPIGIDFLGELLQNYSVDFENFLVAMSFAGGGAAMFLRGHYLNKMSRRSQRYILAIGNADAMSVDEIAKRVNRKPAQAAKELQKLIDKGYLGEDSYIDHERGYFLRFGATLEKEEEEVPVREVPPEPAPKEAQEGYSGVLRNIRRANDRIADPELSRKIDRLEQVSGLIFKEVEEHPEKRNSIRTFFDYYLPTTQKLLDTYADFEETGVEGEHLREAKERIKQTMDAIVEGFEHQLDQLYSTDAMDVVSDIKVMEAMLNRDTASVAKDFGFPEPPKVRPKSDADKEDGDGQMQAMQ